MISYNLLSTLLDRFAVADFNVFIINLAIAIILIMVGVFLGNFVKIILRKTIDKSGINRSAKKSYVALFLSVITWSIYILFVSLALDQLGIPQLTSWLSSTLVIIPALVGSLILIIIGFAMAIYLRELISGSGFLGQDILSMILFYFIIYIFIVFALKTAFIGQDKNTVNTIVIIFTAVISAAVAYHHIKKR